MTVLLTVSTLITMFLVALDRTVIATAIPQITNDFNSFQDVGWYGSAYLLTCCALQLLFGKLYTFFSVKGVLVTSIVIFEASSALCGAAPNSVAFIIGRAFSGIGAAGIFAGTITTILYVIPLHKRPKIQGMFGTVMGISSITGPIIGGAFTTNVTWRWNFYINLPISCLALLALYFFLHIPPRAKASQPLTKKLAQLDFPGTALVAPGVTCLLLAPQWGGQTYGWGNARIIALFVLAGVLLGAFAVVQVLLPATATIPPRLFKNRSVVAGLWQAVLVNCGNYIVIYFLPIWFQTVTGVSAVQSGIRTLPLMISTILGSISGSLTTQKVGYYTQFAITGTCLMSIGAGFLTTLEVDTSEGKWIGYQIIYGIGFGWCFQVPNLAIQTSLLGATIFVSVGQNVLSNQLMERLSAVIPGFDPSLVTSMGVTSLLESIPTQFQDVALIAYNESLRKVFVVGLIPTCLSVLGAACLEWRSTKKGEVKAEKSAEDADADKVKDEEKQAGAASD
ncbi:major facilitator superfamily domain-containing protein [Cercophora scortea]|uniref:Major facilitator superfamily domain-containing protein n=1 Tax=Cercophora scortea TaxID=314031 RepID=A0AAE0MDG5_9PEZI|nr:major facilitator superfamily domain-containing protein [Cercophora scortea]